MASVIETERSILEELEVIENALSKRFKRNPNLLPSSALAPVKLMQTGSTSKKRPFREVILQQHEVKFFVERYKELASSIINSGKEKVLDEQLVKLRDPSHNFQEFDKMFASIKEQHDLYDNQQQLHNRNLPVVTDDVAHMYEMFSSRPDDNDSIVKRAKRKHILSKAASHIDLRSTFSEEEEYGKSLYLVPFFETYKNLVENSTISYVEYLSLYDVVPYSAISNRKLYAKYLDELLAYQLDFIRRSRPFEDIVLSEIQNIKIETAGVEATDSKVEAVADGSTNEKGEIFCLACDKWFAKESVYKGHLTGKKHIKNSKRSTEESSQEGPSQEKSVSLTEQKIRFLGKYLKRERECAINSVERKANSTERERLLEIAAARDEESQLTDIESGNDSNSDNDSGANSDDDDDDANGFKNLPVGADGQPMPFWLYKLQGYHKSYNCEVCGDITYKGRVVFSKHFTGLKHQQGLKMLGVNDESLPLFKNITKIDEAIELWRRIKRTTRIREGDTENAIEVEDADGNVMSKKDYEELKRQGLL
ncbi:pre-mRNA-splicing factor Prp9p [[Candida] railenensis]|uniref:Pre-mRNA-splicing factor Prp9p n=1 Tax=[Candida] railenensis TaxID=45579 RepID=A0A9P0QME3_9ASCO|nr:pre-mRNA-splicing factor Prp9p [[Candida] railenensis]